MKIIHQRSPKHTLVRSQTLQIVAAFIHLLLPGVIFGLIYTHTHTLVTSVLLFRICSSKKSPIINICFLSSCALFRSSFSSFYMYYMNWHVNHSYERFLLVDGSDFISGGIVGHSWLLLNIMAYASFKWWGNQLLIYV